MAFLFFSIIEGPNKTRRFIHHFIANKQIQKLTYKIKVKTNKINWVISSNCQPICLCKKYFVNWNNALYFYFRTSSEGSWMENQRRHKSVRWSWVKYPEQVVLDIRDSSVRSYCLCTANRLNFGRYYKKFWSRSMKSFFKSIVWFKYLKLFPELKCGSVFQKQLYCSIHENFQ